MTFTLLLGYDTIRVGNSLQDILTRYTCPNDGYIRAWQDSSDPNLVWLIPTCPVDPVKASLIVNIGNFVNSRYNYSDKIIDAHARIETVFTRVADDANVWLSEHTGPEIATFLGDNARMRVLIFNEMKNQGIVG